MQFLAFTLVKIRIVQFQKTGKNFLDKFPRYSRTPCYLVGGCIIQKRWQCTIFQYYLDSRPTVEYHSNIPSISMKSPVQDESTNDLPVPTGPFVSKEKESDVEQGSKRMQQNPAKKELSHVTWQKYSTL